MRDSSRPRGTARGTDRPGETGETPPPGPIAGCPFCSLGEIEELLTESASFYVAADHAPLVGGHILIIPRAHYACFGAIPATLEAELLGLKEQVRRFLSDAYRLPSFFEHGVFHQTVSHAHLHAIPLGPSDVALETMAVASGGEPLRSLADLRAWYATRGQYFLLETPGDPEKPSAPQAAIFPPELGVYGRALATVRQLAATREGWSPQPLRYATRGPKVRALTQAWRAWETNQGV